MPAAVIKMPTNRFVGSSMLGSNTKITHNTMNIIGMAKLTRIGRGRSGLKFLNEKLGFIQIIWMNLTQLYRHEQLTWSFAAIVKQQYWPQRTATKFGWNNLSVKIRPMWTAWWVRLLATKTEKYFWLNGFDKHDKPMNFIAYREYQWWNGCLLLVVNQRKERR